LSLALAAEREDVARAKSMDPQTRIAFQFSGFDALPCFTIVIAGIFSIPLIPWIVAWAGLLPSAYLFAAAAILAAGMRVSVTVSQDSVCVKKKWLVVPYRIYRAREIHDIWYAGDWGLEDNADCVVLQLGDAEVNVGSSRSMKHLHDKLWPLSTVGRSIASRSNHDSDRADPSSR
jgi:hypothetical protein